MPTPILTYQPGASAAGSGSAVALGIYLYWPDIKLLVNGTATNPTLSTLTASLDMQDISILPDNTLIKVAIPGRGASEWLRVVDATSPVTNLDTGVIRPSNYDPSLRPYVLNRQSGL